MDEPRTDAAPPTCASCNRPATADAAEPVTHCEWCGAEYPTPDEDETTERGDAGAV